jgi:hypothetical protein
VVLELRQAGVVAELGIEHAREKCEHRAEPDPGA